MADSADLKEMKRLLKATDEYVKDVSNLDLERYQELKKAIADLTGRVAALEGASKKK